MRIHLNDSSGLDLDEVTRGFAKGKRDDCRIFGEDLSEGMFIFHCLVSCDRPLATRWLLAYVMRRFERAGRSRLLGLLAVGLVRLTIWKKELWR